MKNIVELRDGLCKVFDGLNNGTIDTEQASQLTNCAGKAIGTLRVELEYAQQRGEIPSIKFMHGGRNAR